MPGKRSYARPEGKTGAESPAHLKKRSTGPAPKSSGRCSPFRARKSLLLYADRRSEVRRRLWRARRFNRLDPFFGNIQDPQSLHKYLFVHGDPIQGTDPTGWFLGVSMSGLLGAFMYVSAIAYVGTSVIEAAHGLHKNWEIGFGGYDATDKLLELRTLLRDRWHGTGGQAMLSDTEKQQISTALHSAGTFIGWDIEEMLLNKAAWASSTGPDIIPHTLTFRNRVYHVAEVNYVWWGMLNRVLYESGIDTVYTNKATTVAAAGAYRLLTGPVLGFAGMFWDRNENSPGKIAWTTFGWEWAGPGNQNIEPPTMGEFPYAIPNWQKWPYWLKGRVGSAGSVLTLYTTGRRPPDVV